ncbi:MAG: hypothetical protein GXY09_02375 [Bacteroidales bacterium]|nr:hypothetical protein [Bacteroidales bacterium]
MKEIHEFRIFKDYYHLLPQPNNAKFNGAAYVINIAKTDPLFKEIGVLDNEVKEKNNQHIFGFWDVKRSYSKKELTDAELFHLSVVVAFEPTGEECGTIYDEEVACEICGVNRKQVGILKLKKGSIPKKDIARTIAGEIVVSERFVTTFKKRGLVGIVFKPVAFGNEISNYYQLITSSNDLELTGKTLTGVNPFNFSTESTEASEFSISGGYEVRFQKEVYRCPNGHTIGARILSEPYIRNTPSINAFDFFASKQRVGVKQGLLRPEPIYLCSPAFKKMVEEEKLSGFEFEIAHIIKQPEL